MQRTAFEQENSTGSMGPASEEPDRRQLVPSRAVALSGVIVIIGFSTWMLFSDGFPLSAVGAYLLYVALGVVAPGTLVHKSLRGPMASWLADLSLGAATGLTLQLIAWAAASLLDVRGLLWAWPLLTLPLLLRGSTRARVLARPTRRWTWAPSLAVTLAVLQAIWVTGRPYLRAYDLPPTAHPYYPDLLWHMGLAWEARRSFPLGTPQVVEDGPLLYHWFSNAHIAAGSLMTGVDVPTVTLGLWFMPIVALTVTLSAVLTERLTGRPWAAAAASWLAFPTLSYPFWPDVVGTSNAMNPLSPSQLYSVPLTLALVHAMSDLLREGAPRHRVGNWVVVVLMALAASGAKASALPVVVGGVGLAFVAALFLRRSRMVLLALGVVLSGFTVVALKFVAGGSAGSTLQLFSSLSILLPYRRLIAPRPDFDQPVLDGLVGAPGIGPVLLVGLLLIILVAYVRAFGFVLPIVQTGLRKDLTAWLLAGACLAAMVPFFVLAHRGYSQYYFLFGVLPFGAILWVWSLSLLVGDSRSRAKVVSGVLAVVGVASVGLGAYAQTLTRSANKTETLAALYTFVLQVGIGAVVVLGILVTGLWLQRRRNTVLVPVAMALLLAPPLAAGPFLSLQTLLSKEPERPTEAQVLAQTEAAKWISEHVPEKALTATNDHCLARANEGTDCYSRQWWISGIAGRRVLIESWGYTPRGAVDGYYDPALYATNQAAFTRPTPEIIATLRQRGVTWLVGERDSDQEVSPLLAQFTTKRYDNGRVAVYEITP